jgi:protein arginine kinase activator
MGYSDFRKGGKLGCAECYKAFKKPIEALLLRVHGNTQHAGKIPGGLKSDVSIRLNIDRLKQQLVKAIAEEAYEDAAQLRDQIRALNAQLEAEQAVKEGGAQDE